jgi:copper chaperone CopZ
LGVTTATAFFKPLLLSPFFFYILIALSLIFASVSVIIYLKKHSLLSFDGIKTKWKYISILYGTTLGVNVLLFLFIFPLAANMTSATDAEITDDSSEITLSVDIPCPGHAPLITGELKTIDGVQSVKFRFPDYFDINYDSKKTSQGEITSLAVFNTYPAKIISGFQEVQETQPIGCSTCNSCSGACGGTCGT